MDRRGCSCRRGPLLKEKVAARQRGVIVDHHGEVGDAVAVDIARQGGAVIAQLPRDMGKGIGADEGERLVAVAAEVGVEPAQVDAVALGEVVEVLAIWREEELELWVELR